VSAHRIFVGVVEGSSERVEALVQLWDEPDGSMAELAFRSDPSHTWGAPIVLVEVPS
jgi:hypothetical protein